MTVRNTNGKTTVTGWDAETVRLNAVKRTRLGAAELDRVAIDGTVTGGVLVLRTVSSGPLFPRVMVEMDVQVPRAVRVGTVSSTNGEVDIRDTGGDVMAEATNGAITLPDIDGYMRVTAANGAIEVRNTTGIDSLSTLNGEIHADLRHIRSNVTIATSNVRVTLAIVPSLDAVISASTANGDVTAELIPLNATVRERTRMEGTMGNGGFFM